MKRVGSFPVLVPLAGLVLLATACREAAVPTNVANGLQHDQAAPQRPLQGVLDLQALGWTEPAEGRCPEGYPMLSSMAGSGHFTHLGLTSAAGSHCIDPATLAFTRGQLTLIAANGDELYGTYEGVTTFVEPPLVGWADVIVFAGGTGRFASASGQADETGQVNLVTGVGLSTTEGILSF
jgi:hypothetical protein